ncbi:hypothetical protein EUGRSUZ_H05050 [Eucalyptus grandis]|uniref:Uncharacterized protein n=2 Tax=Eucalyptus grandis TaxID=71139 RepID=A0ACC3K0L4_EUCGR|nr:hypothetical protein EUGRSUZ_H05050 [Eucalyptus grandis]
MQETIALYAAPALHHMVSMGELGKLILHHRPQFTLTVLVASMPATASAITSYIDRIYYETNLPISFFHLPPVHLPESLQNQVDAAFEFMRLNIMGVRDALQSISADCAVRALITSAFHVPHHFLNIPTYCYFTSCASVLSFFLQLPAIHDQTSKSFGDSKDTLLHLPGLPTMRASLLPEPLLDRNASAYRHFLDFARSLPIFHGLIANTFNLLEPDAVKAVADGVCVPDGMTPPLYCIGSLIADAKDRTIGSVASLEASTMPPRRSVVFLCFGSRGAFASAQVREIALGLERSEQRFLWVVRNPPPSIATKPDLDHLLPQGFLERTRNKGLVMKTWAPQAAILKHESVGGIRDSLWVELGVRSSEFWGSDGGLAIVCRAAHECRHPCGENEAGGADQRVDMVI